MTTENKRTTNDKITLYRRCFTGLTNAYGTYDPATGKAHQVKEAVTPDVILKHLKGEQPYGVYLLVKDCIRAMAVDFDNNNPLIACEFIASARHYEIQAYIERSKSKGYHVWIFFEESGVLASKARLVARNILDEIERPDTEVFPKQDVLSEATQYGNFINAPLFGKLVPEGRTVFIEPGSLKPYPNQWDFLETVPRVPESLLDDIIETNELTPRNVESGNAHNGKANSPNSNSDARTPTTGEQSTESKPPQPSRFFGLPLCAQRMLNEGVRSNQRVSCFRLAVQLRKAGLPYDAAVAVLKVWTTKNRPENGKNIIEEREILAQTASAYTKGYRSCGCEDPAVARYCDLSCPLHQVRASGT